jgi:hypothetical protein
MRTYQHTAFSFLDGYDILYAVTKATQASVQSVGFDFYIDADFAFPQRCKRVLNKTARFLCIFGSTDAYGV